MKHDKREERRRQRQAADGHRERQQKQRVLSDSLNWMVSREVDLALAAYPLAVCVRRMRAFLGREDGP